VRSAQFERPDLEGVTPPQVRQTRWYGLDFCPLAEHDLGSQPDAKLASQVIIFEFGMVITGENRQLVTRVHCALTTFQ
jgi:hypothetical protein